MHDRLVRRAPRQRPEPRAAGEPEATTKRTRGTLEASRWSHEGGGGGHGCALARRCTVAPCRGLVTLLWTSRYGNPLALLLRRSNTRHYATRLDYATGKRRLEQVDKVEGHHGLALTETLAAFGISTYSPLYYPSDKEYILGPNVRAHAPPLAVSEAAAPHPLAALNAPVRVLSSLAAGASPAVPAAPLPGQRGSHVTPPCSRRAAASQRAARRAAGLWAL